MIKKKINIIGGGCAGYSFIRKLKKIKNYKFNITGNQSDQDHFWVFGHQKIDFDQICLNRIVGKS